MSLDSHSFLYLIYTLIAASVILLVQSLYSNFSRRQVLSGSINHRLKRMAENSESHSALRGLLKERGLDSDGNFAFSVVWLNRLYTQSGRAGSPMRFVLTYIFIGLTVSLAVRLFFGWGLLICIGLATFISLGLPLLVLRRLRKKRLEQFGKQLPDALDMIVRSLRAGHPAPIAIALVAREMRDPIGSEFGIVTDEISFGLNLQTAVSKMAERVGHEGLQLLSVAVSIQAETGGNLTEILSNLSTVLRERQKLRLKIRSLSAEGRLSAILISCFPFAMFSILILVAPSYYGDVWGDPIILPIFLCFGIWAFIGNYIMYRMCNFDY